MISPQSFLTLPLNFKPGLTIYPPSVEDIITDVNYGRYAKIFTISQEELEDEFLGKGKATVAPTPFEFLLASSYQNPGFETLVKEAFKFFCKVDITFFYEEKKILIGDLQKILPTIKDLSELKKLIFLTEEEYFGFQNAIRDSIGEKEIEPPRPNEDPRVKRIKAKARYRDKIKAKLNIGSISLTTCLASICCMGIGLTPLNIGKMSYSAIGLLMGTYQEQEKYRIDIDSLLAGADSKKVKPKYWIRNLE